MFYDIFFLIICYGFIIMSLTCMIKGWTYRNSKVEDHEVIGGNIYSLIFSYILPYLPKRIIQFCYIAIGLILYILSSALCMILLKELLNIPFPITIGLILPIITLLSIKPAQVFRKPMVPFPEELNKIIGELRDQEWFEKLYSDPQYTFLFHKNEAIQMELGYYNLNKIRLDNKYKEKTEKRLRDKLINEFLCTPKDERHMDDINIQ